MPVPSLKFVFVLIAAACAVAVLFGVDADQLRVLAVGLLSAAIAIVVP